MNRQKIITAILYNKKINYATDELEQLNNNELNEIYKLIKRSTGTTSASSNSQMMLDF